MARSQYRMTIISLKTFRVTRGYRQMFQRRTKHLEILKNTYITALYICYSNVSGVIV